MKLKFWGVRGGIPVPGEDTVEFGGDTVCLDITDDREDDCDTCRAVLDAGTGITHLGGSLLAGPAGKGQGEIHVFLTHTHWDHIQGIPYFIPAFIPGNQLTFWGRPVSERPVEEILEGQMRAEYNPIFSLSNMGSTISVREIDEKDITFGAFTMKTLIVPHLGLPSVSYRISDGDSDVAFLGDVDYISGEVPKNVPPFIHGADLLIHDIGEDGVDSFDNHVALKLAKAAEIPRLILTHFAPHHSDADIRRMLEDARKSAGSDLKVDVAKQGMELSV